MSQTIHEIDPKGDTLLILRNANAPFAVLPPPPDEIPQNKESELGSSPADEPQDPDKEPEVRMKLSSKHLALASTYFAKLTANNWKETAPEDGYSYVVHGRDWDEKALLILMNIIHGRTSKVPESVSLEMLAKVSVLVDYYQCHEAVGFFAKTWIKGLTTFPSFYKGRDAFLRLSVCWVFSEAAAFEMVTETIIEESERLIDSLGLPIPHGIVDALNERREDIISGLVLGLHGLKIQLCEEKGPCSDECSSMRLGTLNKSMHKMGILDPRPDLPYLGHSVLALEEAIRSIKEPSSQGGCPSGLGPLKQSAASLKPLVPTPPSSRFLGGLAANNSPSSSDGLFATTPSTSGLFSTASTANNSSTSGGLLATAPTAGGLFGSASTANNSSTSGGLLATAPTAGGLFGSAPRANNSSSTSSPFATAPAAGGLFGFAPRANNSSSSDGLSGTIPTASNHSSSSGSFSFGSLSRTNNSSSPGGLSATALTASNNSSAPAAKSSSSSAGLLGSSPTTTAKSFCKISVDTKKIINKQSAKMGGLDWHKFTNMSF